MAFGRDDNAEMRCRLKENNNSLAYMLNVPGNGTKPDYFVDPFIRLQGFGANLSTNIVDINSKLRGVNKQLNRDHFVENTRDPDFNPIYKQYVFPSNENAITEQSRTITPAWETRGLERIQWDYPIYPHQFYTEIRFAHNINSRQDEKDQFRNKCGM
tara:strand:- start:149 stop:619 length:471 start_codon:yes stop_codon:yes gene_type:complete